MGHPSQPPSPRLESIIGGGAEDVRAGGWGGGLGSAIVRTGPGTAPTAALCLGEAAGIALRAGKRKGDMIGMPGLGGGRSWGVCIQLTHTKLNLKT